MSEITEAQFQQFLAEVFMKGVAWGKLTSELDTTEVHDMKAFRSALPWIMEIRAKEDV